MLYCQGIPVAERMSKEPSDGDLRGVSGARHSQPGLTLGLSSLAVSSHPQSPWYARHRARVADQRLVSGLEEIGVLVLKQQMVLEQERTTRLPSPTPS